MKNALSKIEKFFFAPASARPIAALRIGLSLLLLAQAYLLRNSLGDFFSSDGLVQGGLAAYLGEANVPTILWFSQHVGGISEAAFIQFFCVAYVISLVFLALGLFSRATSVAAWALHWLLVNSSSTTSYGVDLYAHVFLFYLMFLPSGDAFSVATFTGRKSERSSWMARLGLRVMQLHLCLSYLASGIDKAKGPQWWNGELLWRALNLPVYYQYDMTWLAKVPFLLKVGGWTTLLVEIGYCVFIWPKFSRRLWIAAVVSLHLGIAVFLGLGIFGLVMGMLTLTLFGVDPEGELALRFSKTTKPFDKSEVALANV